MKKLISILTLISLFSVACTKNVQKTEAYEKQVVRIMKASNLFETKFNKDSNGLAKLFSQHLKVQTFNNNILILEDGSLWTFVSDGICEKNNSCKIIVETKNKKEQIEFPIKFDKQKKFVIDTNNISKTIVTK